MSTSTDRNGRSIFFSQALFALIVFQVVIISISIAAASIAFGLAVALVLFWMISEKRWLFSRTALDYFFLAYVIIEFVCAFNAVIQWQAFYYSKRLLLIGNFYFAVLAFNSRSRFQTFIFTLAGVIGFLSLYEIAHYFLVHEDRLSSLQSHMTAGGLKMIIGLLILPYLFNTSIATKHRILLGISFLAIFVALILTQTRSSWLGFIAGVIVMSILRYRKLFAVLVALIISFFLFAPAQYVNRAKSITDLSNESNRARIYCWCVALQINHHYPILGVGDTGIESYYKQYRHPSDPTNENYGHLHDNFAQLLATLGLVGLAIVVALFVKIFLAEYRLFRDYKNDALGNSVTLASLAIFTGFQINGLFEWNFGDHEIMVFVWLSIGLCFAVDKLLRSEKMNANTYIAVST